jgi:hypothetical protein
MKQNISELTKWIPLSEVKDFFNYKATQISTLLKDETIKVANVGKRKFVQLDSIERFLEKKSKPKF